MIPSSLQRCEWIARVLIMASSPEPLVEEIISSQAASKGSEKHPGLLQSLIGPWTLNHVRMMTGSRTSLSKPSPYTSKTLLCAVAHALGAAGVPAPALDPHTATDHLLLMETDDQWYLIQKLPTSSCASNDTERMLQAQRQWSQRPFPYSSATNWDVATMIMDLLAHRIQHRTVKAATAQPPPPAKLLDATCGSGTFLALAMDRGMTVMGWDSNPLCVAGTLQNLAYVYGAERVERDCHVAVRNCLQPSVPDDPIMTNVTCVASNLPWGVNSHLRSSNTNTDTTASADPPSPDTASLLASIRQVLSVGVPCVFLYKENTLDDDDDDDGHNNAESAMGSSEWWKALGYQYLGHAHIPPRDFLLPMTEKHVRKEPNKELRTRRTGRSDCVIAVVETMER